MPRPPRLGLHEPLRWAGAAVRRGQPGRQPGRLLGWMVGAAAISGCPCPNLGSCAVTPPHSDMQLKAGPWHGNGVCWKQGQSRRHPLQQCGDTSTIQQRNVWKASSQVQMSQLLVEHACCLLCSVKLCAGLWLIVGLMHDLQPD